MLLLDRCPAISECSVRPGCGIHAACGVNWILNTGQYRIVDWITWQGYISCLCGTNLGCYKMCSIELWNIGTKENFDWPQYSLSALLVDWATELKENALKYRMNRTVTLKHCDYSFASCTIHTTQAEVCIQVLQMSKCDCLNVVQFWSQVAGWSVTGKSGPSLNSLSY